MSEFKLFTHRLHSCLSESHDPHECAAHAAKHLTELIAKPDFLEDQYRVGAKDEPKANLIYVSPDGLFSVVAFVWQTGQKTCIHDHVCWCVVGVLEGVEEETSFKLLHNKQETWLEPIETKRLDAGDVCQLVPPGEDIHQVKNAGQDTAISIHVYGTDIGKWGSSINRRFDTLPVYEGKKGMPVSWRDKNLGKETGIHL